MVRIHCRVLVRGRLMAGHDTLNVGTVVRPHPSEPAFTVLCDSKLSSARLTKTSSWPHRGTNRKGFVTEQKS